jgi:hypothetical protein
MLEEEFMSEEDIIRDLKIELALRKDNDLTGTGMGGNPSQLYYLMTHDVKVRYPLNINQVNIYQKDNVVVFDLLKGTSLKDIRKVFNNFWETCPDKNEFTQKNLADVSFVSHLDLQSADVHLLLYGLNIANDLVKWLDREAVLITQISSFFTKEYEATEYEFLAEMQLPGDYFKKFDERINKLINEGKGCAHLKDPMRKVLHNHPVWGKRWDAISKRETSMMESLFSQEDLDKVNKIGSLPPHIALFVMRSIVTIDRLVKHNIDEKQTFLTEINKVVNSITKKYQSK